MNEEEREKHWEQQRLEGVIVRSLLPRHSQRTRRLEGFNKTPGNEAALAATADFLAGLINPPLLLFFGPKGLGKTRLAYHIAWTFIEEGAEFVLYYQAEDLLNTLQAAQVDGKEFGQLWRNLKDAELLILDDVGANNPSAWRESQMDAILDARYREEKATIVTSNKLDFPERMLDRLKEGRTVMLKGESWRGQGAGQ